MWMFGKVNAEEKHQLLREGWEIDRSLTSEEVDRFVDPDWKGKTEKTDDEFLLLYFDEDLSDVCRDILAQRLAKEVKFSAELELKRQKELDDLRTIAADEVFEEYDMHEEGDLPEGCHVIDSEGWYRNGTRFEKLFYYENPDGGDSLRATFVVHFAPESDKIINEYVNIH